MTRACLALGGNIGDVAAEFVRALEALAGAQGVEIVALSRVWRTPPWGVTDQPDFLNMAAMVETSVAPRALLDLCLDVEKARGRVRDRRWGPRNIDIDVIAYGDLRVDEPDLTVPHPRAHERAFVLAPLADIAPDMTLNGERVRDLLATADSSGVRVDEEATERLARSLPSLRA